MVFLSFDSPAGRTASRRHGVESLFDLLEGTIEAAFTADEDAERVGSVKVVVDGGVERGDVLVGKGEDPVAGRAVLGLEPLAMLDIVHRVSKAAGEGEPK